MLDLGSASIFKGVFGILLFFPKFFLDVFDFYFTFAVSCAVAYATGFDLNLISVFIWFSL